MTTVAIPTSSSSTAERRQNCKPIPGNFAEWGKTDSNCHQVLDQFVPTIQRGESLCLATSTLNDGTNHHRCSAIVQQYGQINALLLINGQALLRWHQPILFSIQHSRSGHYSVQNTVVCQLRYTVQHTAQLVKLIILFSIQHSWSGLKYCSAYITIGQAYHTVQQTVQLVRFIILFSIHYNRTGYHTVQHTVQSVRFVILPCIQHSWLGL